MSAEDDAPYYCIPQSRCRLCQFELEEGEDVVAAIDDKRVSPEFSFFRNKTFYDDDIFGIKFHMCCRNTCGFQGRQSPCFHAKCYSFRLYTVSPKFLATTHYSFRPPIAEERRRKNRMLRILMERLKASWAKRLPVELCRIIAGFLIRECAVITSQELANEDSETDSVVDLSYDVYVHYVMIDGIRYIRSLRNSSRSATKPGETLLLDAQTARNIRNIYIGEDHLGIREVRFSSSSTIESKSELGITRLWWRKLSGPCGILKIRTRIDGLKLRDLVGGKDQSITTPTRVYWPVPESTATIIDLASLQRPLNVPNGLRMSFFECNAAHTTGYSVATNGTSSATIQMHDKNIDLSFYEGVDFSFGWSMVWIYMPIDKGEYVTEICRRFGFRHIGLDSLGLMFTTNRGRTTLFGSYMPPPSSSAEYQIDRIYSPLKTPSRIYFNEWDSIMRKEIKFLGFERTEPPIPRPYPKPLIPISSCPQTTYNEPWFYSFCPMEDVIEITLCIDKTAYHRPIIGMLLRYSNEHRACVGQFRLDWVRRPIEVSQAGKLHIGIKRTKKGYPYVADINVHSPTDRSSTSWLDVSWNGFLEWSFSHRQCKLYYNSD